MNLSTVVVCSVHATHAPLAFCLPPPLSSQGVFMRLLTFGDQLLTTGYIPESCLPRCSREKLEAERGEYSRFASFDLVPARH